MEQVDIFDLLEVKEPAVLDAGLIDMNDVFSLEKGTKVYIDYSYSLMYEVIEDDGHSATLKYVRGYKGKQQDEIRIPSLQIVAIAEPDFIPLPTAKRPQSLDIEQYKGLEKQFLTQLSEQEKLDMLTYITVLSAFNTSPDKFLRFMKEGNKELALCQIGYGSSYIRPCGSKNAISIMYSHQDKTFQVHYFKNYSKAEVYESEVLLKNYERIHGKIQNMDVAKLNPFELMVLYREKGYVLRYRIETDEWFIQHPYSSRDMAIPKGRESLNDLAAVIQKYERKVVKTGASFSMVNTELDLFGEDITKEETVEQNGFALPKDILVSINEDRRNQYNVVLDDGENAVLVTEEGRKKEVKSKDIRFIYPFKNKHISVPLPSFNRPASLTVKTLLERRESYYSSLSDKEIKDIAIAQITRGTYETSLDKFKRAMQEGNEEAAKEVLSGHTGGRYSSNIRLSYSSNKYTFEYGENKKREIALSINEIVNYYKQMVRHINILPTQRLSLGELTIAYRLKNYNLSYDHITDEYRLSHRYSNTSVQILKGRNRLNKIDETIELCEKILLKK
ncbi:hypothetical protein [Virgibacillus halodenitrificans]|uniref:hypothetical protein n=1 Tax=Virgibacillus halodenitrificans TaxID=1482 RepID=UPI000EF4BC0A|nr:hypothetical protein [Virgibacillus halodenitrificans]